MNTKLISVILVLGVLVIAVISNPKEQPHAKKISAQINPNENVLIRASYEKLTEQILDYNNYLLFSIAQYDNVKSLGLFGSVIILSSTPKTQISQKQIKDLKNSSKDRETENDEEKRRKLDNLIGGSNSNKNYNQSTRKGELNGNPYKPSYFEEGLKYGLHGRGKPSVSIPLTECNEEGKVVLKIYVNQKGRVIQANPIMRDTSISPCLIKAAQKSALLYKWAEDLNAPSKQIGFVVIEF